jgi:Ca2+-binding EF-hand superfamily protein
MNEDLIAIIKRLDINKDGIVDLCELHAFFGFPNCTFCCSCNECPVCGICCCDECLSDIPCYLHKCVHHQNHSPLKRKTLCYSDTNKGDEQEEEVYYSPLRKLNKDLNKDMPLTNYDLNNGNSSNIGVNCIICGNCEEQEKNNKFSTPRENYNNSNSEMGSTLQSFSPSCQNCSQNTIIREGNPSSSNFNCSFFLKDGEYEEEQFNNYLTELMSVENDIEKGKIELLACNDFNYEDVFAIFDTDHKCCLTFEDLKYGLGKLDLYPVDNEIKLLFNRFDPQRCGNINYENFMIELQPCDRTYRNKIDNLPCIGNKAGSENNLSYDTKLYLKNLLKVMISGEYKLNILREEFSGINYSLKNNIFGLIDLNGCGFFMENDLKNYLIQNGIFRDDKRCALLFYKLDKKKDGKVDICEIENEFQNIV